MTKPKLTRPSSEDAIKAWAIDARSEEGYGLIGKYWWFNKERPCIQSHMEGAPCALFKTKKKAIEGLRDVRPFFAKARVCRVKVTVEVIA
jgi:hypothetical protein